jgi:hypothetical protein
MNLNLATNDGSVEISEAAFGREFNEALVAVRVPGLTRAGPTFAVVVVSPGGRKAPVVPVPAPSAARSGAAAV